MPSGALRSLAIVARLGSERGPNGVQTGSKQGPNSRLAHDDTHAMKFEQGNWWSRLPRLVVAYWPAEILGYSVSRRHFIKGRIQDARTCSLSEISIAFVTRGGMPAPVNESGSVVVVLAKEENRHISQI
jgi:hypothetical protein